MTKKKLKGKDNAKNDVSKCIHYNGFIRNNQCKAYIKYAKVWNISKSHKEFLPCFVNSPLQCDKKELKEMET